MLELQQRSAEPLYRHVSGLSLSLIAQSHFFLSLLYFSILSAVITVSVFIPTAGCKTNCPLGDNEDNLESSVLPCNTEEQQLFIKLIQSVNIPIFI